MIWNAQSIYPKREELFDFLLNNKIHLALISETWLRRCVSLYHPKFSIVRNDRKNGIHGGVAIIIRKGIQYEIVAPLKTKVIENVGISMLVENRKIEIFAAYFPGSSNSQSLQDFNDDISMFTRRSNSFLVGGDLNAKHGSWNCSTSNRAGDLLFKNFSQNNFAVYFPPEPTHYPISAKASSSTIDLVLSNALHNISQLEVINSLSSDHLPVSFSIESSIDLTNPDSLVYCYRKADWKSFKNHISCKIPETNSNIPLDRNVVDQELNSLTKIIQEARDLHIPKIRPKAHQLILTDKIKIMICDRNRIRRTWQRNRDRVLADQIKKLNWRIRQEIKQMKNENWSSLLRTFDRVGSGKFWKCTKLVRKKRREIPDLKVKNRVLSTDKEKSEAIASHFKESHSISKNIHSPHQFKAEKFCETLSHSPTNMEPLEEISWTEIAEVIKKVKNTNSAGFDEIPNSLIKHLPYEALLQIARICNSCLGLGYFPDKWKMAKVIPIPKPDKKLSDPSSFRPISLLPCLGKIFEHCILSRLNLIVSRKELLINEQYGFRKGHSTAHQLLRLKNQISQGFKNKLATGLVLLDVEKAFDAVWHEGLIYKLHTLGIPLSLLKILFSFLNERSSNVCIGADFSKAYDNYAGVPQGAVLSPTLFNLFVCDLPKSPNCELSIFADDTALMSSARRPKTIIKNLQLGLRRIAAFFESWKIRINPSKSQCIFFTRRIKASNKPSTGLKFEDIEISWSDEVKYLGVLFDKRITFKSHVDYACNKALKFIRILYPLINRRSSLYIDNKMLLYKSIFRAILTYGAPVWASCAKTHLLKVQRVQNKCLKIIHNLPFFFSTEKLHEAADIELINKFLCKLSNKFRSKCEFSDNPHIRMLALS